MRTAARLTLAAATGAAAVMVLPGAAYADNCGSMSDCYYTARAALAALVGLSVLFGVLLSVGLDFVPGVGTVKGVIEAITGKDLITGQELAWWERLLGIVPVIGGAAGVAAAIAKGGRAIDDIADVGRAADRIGDAAEAARDAERAAEAARDAERAAEAARDAERAAEAARDAERAREAERAAEAAREARMRELGMDPATGRYRAAEGETALRVEDATGAQLSRSTNPNVDWVDTATGKTYDAVGNFPARHFDQQWPNLQTRIVDHLAKADYVPVDVSQFTPDQIAKVQKFITDNGLGPRAFLVGN
ncbi:pre-toxin TG domain-containing protein [Catellatospora sp. NPDC049609]|uniref:pre-toxin TG domain-containing protein n=1 Tax=Catellatospora sp. NPDC049609 TaxID=3155505 RepID=UPI003414EE32